MIFGDFDEANCFHIEKTSLRKILSGKGMKSVEFVLSQPSEKRLLFVEARKTLPSKNNAERFFEDIAEISNKFIDSLHLICGIWFGTHNLSVEVPENKESFFQYGMRIIFILVIKNRKGDLPHIEDMIKKQLLHERRLLGFDVLALNEDNAKENNLIVTEAYP